MGSIEEVPQLGQFQGGETIGLSFQLRMKNTLAGSSSFGLSNLFSTFPRAPCSLYSSFKLCVQSPNPLDLHSDLLVYLPSSPFDPEQWRMVCVNKIICEELSYSCDLLKHLGGREEMRGQIQVDKDGEPRA
ncbi:unnamed protein product [Prunus armeniaca]|uniref:Uncharacterized protein n=1 Tax=Prunus armeniaca TaxID=36596 RepID=A0A6J5V4W4_PRUAR|nr:unnamed protein product [Prunus armeniaca]